MPAKLIVALDVETHKEALSWVDRLSDRVHFYKIGLELFSAEGPSIVREIKQRGVDVFLDLKLHDIPRTVARTVDRISTLGVDLLTVHAVGGRDMLREAASAASDKLQLVAVTTLTSLDDGDLRDIGITRNTSEQALALGELAISSGIHGLVTSVHEAQALHERFGDALLVTPGIRLATDDVGDQKRIATPSSAVGAGATHLVVGRPILQATDPVEAARMILQDMQGVRS